ncbi:MAG: iron-containing alcohol dehydrogenase [Candidatus Competibacteraceae bacterium]|nr:iron-containing alcohol dehydrogenase [Candidatus Competibacteraceae bacterium]MBK7982598.1 iron-containing alcohol dehydrogenase [Candidatus Competibacteraceae bacterium]MBK8898856.1 iron-containing alcohol dehydrogenase [Candidatus Competibacteraceae bacterium]MBK8963997.1 iron-containing alcohol dehydrogenase [Candidatus Competibacteraceae bacterium]MBK9951860.1 iron-containing alcohol dehydrogenase [Candidatus Competibacteraceae bacterium]
MLNFSFYNPTKILFGKGQIATIAKEIPKDQHILLTYGGGSIKQNGVYEQVMQALAGRTIHEFAGIEPNPTYETLMQAVELARREKVDFLLAVGGGSVVDGTKFIAAAIPFAGEPWDILAKRGRIERALPLGSVLTLPATGSEMNSGAVVTRRATDDKLAFMHPLVYPRFSVLDPTTTFTLPPRQIGNGVVDAYTHIMEQYLTYPVNAPIQDRFAEGLLLTLIEEGPKALATPQDYDVRANIMWCTTLALNGLIGAGVPGDWATHMIGHEITALHGLDHAQTLAIVLPSMMAVKRETKRAKLLQYAARVWNLTDGDEDARIDAAIAKTRAFFERVGVHTYLGDYGIKADAVPALVGQLERHQLTQLGEHGDVDLAASRKVLELSVAA